MKVITKYEAFDGAVFDNAKECEEYEKKYNTEKSYIVELYFSGFYTTKVRAENREKAKEIAKDNCYPEDISFNIENVEIFEEEE